MALPAFEAQMSKAWEDKTVPGAVVLAKSRDGKVDYAKNFGPWDETTVFPLASMTKLVTSIAVAKAIEEGLFALDTDVAPCLPSLAAQPILSGFSEAGEPVLRRREKTVTLRHLMTHTYGQAYTFLDTELTGRYVQSAGGDVGLGPISGRIPVTEAFDYPLVAEPGEGFNYGPGIDWAGRLVEIVSGVSLDEYVRRHICAPLGVPSGGMTFFPARENPRYPQGGAELSLRDAATGRAVPAPAGATGADPHKVEHCMGGGGLFADMRSYVKVLESILADDEKLLRSETARLLFEPLLGGGGRDQAALAEVFRHPDWVVGWTPAPAEGYSWTLAGLVTPGGNAHRGKGFLQWGGAYNLAWVSFPRSMD